MKNALYISGLIFLTLAGCGASYSSRPSDAAYLFAANGLEYANDDQVLAEIEERPIAVTVARFLRDGVEQETLVAISEEEVILPSGFTSFGPRDMVLTLDGETLTFVDGRATLANGQVIWGYLNYALDHSGTGGFYTYSKFSEPAVGEAIDTEGFFAVGFQTDPAVLLELSGDLTYRGSYFGYGQLVDGEGALINGELETIGAMTIAVDFDRSSVSGQLNGFFDPDETRTPYNMIFVDAAIEGNSFAAAPDMICETGVSCTSATSLGGGFFGPNGVEISGVIGFDETAVIGDTTSRFVGAAGFSTTRNFAEPEPTIVD